MNRSRLIKEPDAGFWSGGETVTSFDGEGLRDAIGEAVTSHMAKFVGGHGALRPLYWSASKTGAITGVTLDFPENEIPEVLAQWAQALGLSLNPPGARPGQLRYAGTIGGWPIEVWAR